MQIAIYNGLLQMGHWALLSDPGHLEDEVTLWVTSGPGVGEERGGMAMWAL